MAKKKIHIGKLIEKTVRGKEMTITEFAKKIRRSRNVSYDIFNRASIDTELLANISRVLEHDFFVDLSQDLGLQLKK